MNAIIALCHFCEMHGPVVIFCTQSFHDPDDPQTVLDCSIKSRTNKKYYGKPEVYQRTSSTSSSSSINLDTSKMKESTPGDCCEACRFVSPSLNGFISNDHDAKVSYISTRHPFHPEIFSIVRQACVRSLSCEVCPGREGPIFFGDQQRGHVYSHTFFIKDSHARGFQRWYSIIVVMMDKIFLLNSWPFLTKHIKTVIEELQEKANKVYEIEQAECPQRVLRLNSLTEMTPGNFRRSRGSKSMRSLEELTSDRDVFANMHLWFTWMLKAGGNRMTEKLLEGPPTEDTVIDLEKQEIQFSETEEGFMLVSTKRPPKYAIPHNTNGMKITPSAEDLKIKNIQQLRKVLGPNMFRTIAYHLIIGNQLIVICDDIDLTTAIVHHFKICLPKGCVRDIPFVNQYVDSYKCNIIGVSCKTSVPAHVRTSRLHIVLEIKNMLGTGCNCEEPLSYRYEINNILDIPDKGPTVFNKMLGILENETFTERVVEEFFISIKEEWMNKAKVLYKFSRTGNRTEEDMHKIWQVLGANERDKQVLKFWMTGLSVQFKNHVLTNFQPQLFHHAST